MNVLSRCSTVIHLIGSLRTKIKICTKHLEKNRARAFSIYLLQSVLVVNFISHLKEQRSSLLDMRRQR